MLRSFVIVFKGQTLGTPRDGRRAMRVVGIFRVPSSDDVAVVRDAQPYPHTVFQEVRQDAKPDLDRVALNLVEGNSHLLPLYEQNISV